MKLSSFSAGQTPELGVVISPDQMLSLSRAAPSLATDMLDLIARWPQIQGEVRRLAQEARDTLAMRDLRLLAPITRPGKIMAIGLNYADHIAESQLGTPEHQLWFTKAITAITGPFDPIQIPKVSQAVDYEAELVAVIGKGGRHISKADAALSVFGYCVGNDVTERAWQHRTTQWSLGKSFDTHAPIGPWITTADEIADPHALSIRGLVNGQLRQNSNTGQMVFNLWDQIAHISQAMTLEAGDLIFTGTPGGVGAGFKPPKYLTPGDRVRIEIEGLGAIENVCAQER
jgi:2-keto-4-pentenoate hydratase/2-oxohepta-3-ene-1,7-dioic acid hydratase in catechol pathway